MFADFSMVSQHMIQTSIELPVEIFVSFYALNSDCALGFERFSLNVLLKLHFLSRHWVSVLPCFAVYFSLCRALSSDLCHVSFWSLSVSQESVSRALKLRVEQLTDRWCIQSQLILNVSSVQIAPNSTQYSRLIG